MMPRGLLASFTKMVSGHIADKLGHRKRLVLVGYALTPVGQALIALATGWPLILLGRLVSWFGKGLRDAVALAVARRAVSGHEPLHRLRRLYVADGASLRVVGACGVRRRHQQGTLAKRGGGLQ